MKFFWSCQNCQNSGCSFNGKARFCAGCAGYKKNSVKHWCFSPVQMKTLSVSKKVCRS